jgi:hypothetical protein
MRRGYRPSIVITIISLAALAACASPGGSPGSSAADSAAPSSAAEPSASAAAELEVTFTATLPDGWTQDGDGEIPFPPSENAFFEVGQGFRVMRADCAGEPEPGVGDDAASFADAIADREGLDASEAEPITVDGLSGVQLDFTVAADGTGATCIDGDDAFVPLWVAADGGFAGSAPGDESRLIVVDKPDGGTLLIWITTTAGEDLADYLDAAMSVVEGLQIEAP